MRMRTIANASRRLKIAHAPNTTSQDLTERADGLGITVREKRIAEDITNTCTVNANPMRQGMRTERVASTAICPTTNPITRSAGVLKNNARTRGTSAMPLLNDVCLRYQRMPVRLVTKKIGARTHHARCGVAGIPGIERSGPSQM